MKALTMTAALGLVLSFLYLACRAESPGTPAAEPAAAHAAEAPPATAAAKATDREAAPSTPGQAPQEESAGKAGNTGGEEGEEGPEKGGSEKAEGEAEGAGAPEGGFDPNAFPPTVSDTDYHQGAWYRDDCLRCHETGVEDAPRVRHEGMAPVLLQAKCRSCHVLIRGSAPKKPGKSPEEEEGFMKGAFPPMIPDSPSHRNAWTDESCLLCHETGNRGAPIVKHENLPKVLLKAKCRSCHVQVRSSKVSAPAPAPVR